MLCQYCGKREATTHIKKIVNGEAAQVDLCPACAARLGYGGMFPGMGLGLSDFLGGFLGERGREEKRGQAQRCPQCGCSFEDIAESGMAGCAQCYQTFRSRLMPSIARIHGKARHVGKAGQSAGAQVKARSRLDTLREELNQAVSEQNFERAAQLRDEIKSLEREANGNE